jgi:carbamoyltransferase
VKKRENFRPFAASVLEEHAAEWFDMSTLEHSREMMYAVEAKESVWDIIPAVLHVDHTCRIQTVTKDINPHYYEMISEFYNYSKVPMVLNTSFNLAGEPLVETPLDAINTFDRSDIKVLWFPEINRVLKKCESLE